MNWMLLGQKDFAIATWTGGTTTQLAIAPEGAVYAKRDFLWRLSSARVELDYTRFTPLPDYDRLLSVLEGGLELKIGEEENIPLSPYQVCAFDGGEPVESWGICTDFNLMVRKGVCRGELQPLVLEPGASRSVQFAPRGGGVLALYCAAGGACLPGEGVAFGAGELLLCRDFAPGSMEISTTEGAAIMAALIESL